ncbi:MAG: hypothetical protein AB7V08_01520 [Elusimicrobiales bacterium]
MNWKQLEDYVRFIASSKWASPAHAEHLNGVDIDCVVKPEADRWVLVEITKENNLEKLRADLAKFASVKPFLFARNIYAECYFVCEDEPPPSLMETGAGVNVKVLSTMGFERLFLDYSSYRHLRLQRKFGSAVDPESGESDPRAYVEVKYVTKSSGREYSVLEIANLLREGRNIILLGNYGAGKSRCVRELFNILSVPQTLATIYPLAIDLRDQWGMKRAHEIIQRHCDDLGAPTITNPVMQILEQDTICLLLDGFDEIGSQTWSDNPVRLTAIRSESLRGVRDLFEHHRGGVLITGREHYFNSDDEMYKCLGLDAANTVTLRCADEFTDAEMSSYLRTAGAAINLPSWVPKRPLVCQLVAKLDAKELAAISDSNTGEAAFWQVFITALCDRERRIHNALDPITIHRLLRRLARITRVKAGDVGPITTEEMSSAFIEVTGMSPVDESALMLQRLSSLGRVAAETSDRCFVDQYILDGLRAEDVTTIEEKDVQAVINIKWKNPLGRLGLTLLAADMTTAPHGTQYHRLLKQSALRQNAILAGDVIAAMLIAADGDMVFDNISISDSHITFLDFSGRRIRGLSISSSVIDSLDITDSNPGEVFVRDSMIQQINGVSAAGGLPDWINNCDIATYESVSTVARIRNAELTVEQRVFVTIVKKLFFQPGSGRQVEALLRGLGDAGLKKGADRILNRLKSDNIIERFPGRGGDVYTPVRKHTSRMGRILMELTLSEDPLWKELR